MNIILIIIMIM